VPFFGTGFLVTGFVDFTSTFWEAALFAFAMTCIIARDAPLPHPLDRFG
jgi:hypothetical protein